MKHKLIRHALMTGLPALSALVVIVAVGKFNHVGMAIIARDVTAVANVHPLTGILSSLGAFLWCASASICGFAAFMQRDSRRRDAFWFLVCSALLSGYLLLDDFFLIHEELSPTYLGLDQSVVYVALGTAIVAYLVRFRRIIVQVDFGLLLLALQFLGASVIIDLIIALNWLEFRNWMFLGQDGSKWLGIAFWFSYCVNASHALLTNTMAIPSVAVQVPIEDAVHL